MALWYWWYTPHGLQCMDDRHFAHLVIQSSKFILFVCVFIRHPKGKPVRSCSSTSIHPNWQGAEVSGTLPHPVQCLEETYRKISNIRRTKSPNLNVSRLVLQLSLPNPMKPVVKSKNEDAVGATPTGDAPTASEWSTILLPTKVCLILETWRY